jgi:hypothetical protein
VIDGAAWRADSFVVKPDSTGRLAIVGYQLASDRQTVVSLLALSVTPSGGGAACPCGATFGIIDASRPDGETLLAFDLSAPSRFPGTIVLQQAANGRVRGSFSFTLFDYGPAGAPYNPPVQRQVTAGQIDLRY